MSVTGKSVHPQGPMSAARGLAAWLATALVVVLAGCAAPQTGASGSSGSAADPAPARSEPVATRIAAAPVASTPPTPAAPPAAASPPRSKPAPPMSDPLPAQRVPDDVPAPARLDVSCKSNADCVVKDVGNCCGYYPRCVNVNAKVDPKAVQAQCARSGMASVCGFRTIEGCECVQGECRDKPTPLEVQ